MEWLLKRKTIPSLPTQASKNCSFPPRQMVKATKNNLWVSALSSYRRRRNQFTIAQQVDS